MSSASSTLGALAVLSIILATMADTESEVTDLLGLKVSTASSTDHRAELPNGTQVNAGTRTTSYDGTRRRNWFTAAVGSNVTTTRTTTTRTRSSAGITDDARRSTGYPEITGATASIATLAIISANEQSSATVAAFKAKFTPPSPPRQERLVGLVVNATENYYSLESLVTAGTTTWTTSTTTAATSESSDLLPGDEGSSQDAGIQKPTRLPIETPQRRASSMVLTSTPTLITTTARTTGGLGKAVVSKTRNDLVGGTFHEIKSAQKINNANQVYIGGKIVKPNVTSVLGKYAPYFEDGQEELNVTTRIGSTVILDCEIGMLGNKTVTWSYHSADVIRLLTVGRNAYSVDQRISLFFRYPTNWRLRIQYATPRDSGLYECQVATYPPLVKKIHLLVTAPILVIMDDSGRIKSGERHLKAGSALRLRCEARDVPEKYNETVIWTRGDSILSEDISENRTTEYIDGREIQIIVSTLVIEKATPRHAGNYSCVVPEKAKTTVAVHVLNGELPAAVHDGNGVSRSVLNLWLIHLTVSYVFSR